MSAAATSPWRDVLVALDASPRAERVLREALELAERVSGRLVVIHVVQLPPELPVSTWGSNPEQIIDDIVRGARRQIESMLRAVPAGRVRDIVVELGSPWRAICNAAKQVNVGVVVIGAHGYGTFQRMLGTTAARVVDHADRPVLVVRAKGVTS